MRWEQHAPTQLQPSAPIVERLCAPPTRSAASSAAKAFSAPAVCRSIGLSIPSQPSPTSSRNHRGRKRRSITRQGYMRLICWTGGSGALQRVRISMVSIATILVVLVALFLVGIKWTIDVIRGWPHRIPISRYLEQQRSRPVTANGQPVALMDEAGSACSALSLAFWSPGTSGPPRICSATVRARARVPGCVGGSVGGAHHAEGGQPHCQQVTTRPGHSLACTFPLLFHCWLRENPLGVVIPKSRLRGALRRPSRMGPELARVLKVMTAYILRMALYWY
jgi:hypothetical protein